MGVLRARVGGAWVDVSAPSEPALDKLVLAQRNGWYSFRAHRSTALSIPAASGELTLIFNTEDYDNANAYNPATGIYTVPVTGVYFVAAQITYAMGAAIDMVELSARVASTWRMQGSGDTQRGAANDAHSALVSGDLRLNAGDQLSILAGHYVGAAACPLTIGAPQKNWFAAHLVYPI